jgi:hypothetical protein
VFDGHAPRSGDMKKLNRRRMILKATVAAFTGSSTHSFAAEDVLESYHMPLETEPHLRTFMQWPVSVEIWDIATENL